MKFRMDAASAGRPSATAKECDRALTGASPGIGAHARAFFALILVAAKSQVCGFCEPGVSHTT